MHEVKIVGLLQDPVLEPPAEALEVPVVDVEHVALHVGGRETPDDPRLLDAGPIDAVAYCRLSVTDASVCDHEKIT